MKNKTFLHVFTMFYNAAADQVTAATAFVFLALNPSSEIACPFVFRTVPITHIVFVVLKYILISQYYSCNSTCIVTEPP